MTAAPMSVHEAANEGADALAYRIERLRMLAGESDDGELVAQTLARWVEAREVLRAIGRA